MLSTDLLCSVGVLALTYDAMLRTHTQGVRFLDLEQFGGLKYPSEAAFYSSTGLPAGPDAPRWLHEDYALGDGQHLHPKYLPILERAMNMSC